MTAWLAQHGRAIRGSFARFTRTPLTSMLNFLVIGLALSLPAGLYAVIENVRAVSPQAGVEPQVSAFMALDATRAEVAHIETRLKQNPRVAKFRRVPREQALEQLKQASGLADIVETLPENPLPDAFVINARDNAPETLDALRDEVRQWPRVAHVQLDAAWARRLDAGLRLAELVVAVLSALLAAALVAVTFNTIRLQVLTQRDEVEVIKLIGATDAFIRRPFLYFGALQGLAGGIAAWLLVAAGVYFLNRNLGELSHVYATLFRLQYLSAAEGATLLLLAAGLGWIGAWLAVNRHLAVIEH